MYFMPCPQISLNMFAEERFEEFEEAEAVVSYSSSEQVEQGRAPTGRACIFKR
jgi:hypothetical protein